MKRNNPAPERTRQSPLAIILLLATFAKNTFRQFWPFIIVFLINPKRSIEFQILIAVAVFSFISLVSSILSYFRFYYQLTEDGLVVEKGIFKKTRIQVPFERIQSVNIEQGLLHQAFNIVKLEGMILVSLPLVNFYFSFPHLLYLK
ncbi:MAG: PH domain-containing protein [Saprospiraceae bacterium]|nr:PH domain-containing protein [Saprospiraceae bacterium]